MVGVAKKLYDEARKPHNQQKIRDVVESVKARRSGGSGGSGGTGGTGAKGR